MFNLISIFIGVEHMMKYISYFYDTEGITMKIQIIENAYK